MCKMKTLLTFRIERTKDYRKNEQNCGHLNPCTRCGKGIKNEKFFVHMNTNWEALPNWIDENNLPANMESQGAFPVGSECKKYIPKEYILSA